MEPDVPLTSTICSVAEHKRWGGNYHLAWVILQSHFWGATYSFTIASCRCVQLSSCVVHSHCHHPVKCWLHGVCFMWLSPLCSPRRHPHFRPFRYLDEIYTTEPEPVFTDKRLQTFFGCLQSKEKWGHLIVFPCHVWLHLSAKREKSLEINTILFRLVIFIL